MLEAIEGVFIVAQTPFDDRQAIDLGSVDTLVDFYARHGANGLTMLGVSGEAGKLSGEEALAVAGRYVARAGTMPVIVGVSSPNLAQLARLTAEVMDAGAAGVMIAPAPGIRTDEDLFRYFETVFATIGDVPVVLQDFPFATNVGMSVPAILELVKRHPQIKVLKEEDLPSLNKITRLRQADGRRIAILTGNNAMYLPLELARGIDGPMAGFSYPEMLSGVFRLHKAGEIAAANDLFERYLPLLRYEAMGFWGVAARKEVMRRRGALAHATMRQPGPTLTTDDHREIDQLIARVEIRLAEAA